MGLSQTVQGILLRLGAAFEETHDLVGGQIAVYSPTKDGSFRRCLLAGPMKAAKLAVVADAKTGMLELREVAYSGTKGEVVMSYNLKAIEVLP